MQGNCWGFRLTSTQRWRSAFEKQGHILNAKDTTSWSARIASQHTWGIWQDTLGSLTSRYGALTTEASARNLKWEFKILQTLLVPALQPFPLTWKISFKRAHPTYAFCIDSWSSLEVYRDQGPRALMILLLGLDRREEAMITMPGSGKVTSCDEAHASCMLLPDSASLHAFCCVIHRQYTLEACQVYWATYMSGMKKVWGWACICHAGCGRRDGEADVHFIKCSESNCKPQWHAL